MTVLSPYRVLDLTEDRGHLAGFMLASLGADVIAIEPPDGGSHRARGPFATAGARADAPQHDRSLNHWAYGRGKRSVVLDLAGSADDRESLRRLVAGADVLIDSGAPGSMQALGLGPSDLAAINPSIVTASITPFGSDGPKADWLATDLTVWASAGPLVLTGDADRPPVRPSVPQAFLHASAEAAGAIIAALYERGSSGLGQHVDVSAQQCCAQATQSMILAAPNESDVASRGAGRIRLGPLDIQLLWPCVDGHVSITFLFGTAIGPATSRFMEWIHEAGYCDASTRDKDWIGYTTLLMTGVEPMSEYERVKAIVGDFCSARTKAELLEGAMKRRLLIAPIAMIDDVAASPQFAARDYWVETEGVRYPGAFARASGTPLPVLGPPPRLGEHTAAVLSEPVRTPSAAAGAAAVVGALTTQGAASRRPLDGVKVLDLMWVMAGPASTRVLADLGATVVRVESSHRVETARTLVPFRRGETDIESSVLFANLNAGKLGAAIDPSMPDGRAVLEDLVRWADVVTESFSPKAMAAWGLGYEQLRAINPRIVMMSSCLFGQTGPHSMFAGYGTMAAALTGFFGVTGWPDRAPSGPFGAYTDYIAPRFATAVLLAALDHQRRTGEGQYLDFAQAEGALHALSPILIDHALHGNVAGRRGNDDEIFHPHGVFPCEGTDRWVAVACVDDAMRSRLSALVGGLSDGSVAAFTSSRSPDDAAVAFQSAGVAAHAVQNSPELYADPQLAARRHFRTLDHPTVGDVIVEGPRFTMSRTPPDVLSAGPTLGQHTMEVLSDFLGYDEERVVELLISGALE